MPNSYVTIYDLQMQKVAYIENAFNISYQTPMNTLWGASFSLPANDPKAEECKPLYFAEIFDGDERLELFRILPSNLNRSNDGMTITYDCEHVLGTLLDDILFQYHTVGNLGVYTSDVLQYILSKQSNQRWQLGTVEFDRQFEYNWENENLLGALYSVPKPFDTEYMWTFDTTSYPWTLNLVHPSNEVQAYIRYGVNMRGIERKIDPSGVVTRLYGLGYGEGINQLTFADINGGKPYIDAEPEYIQKYGIMQSVYVDRRIEYPETLLANAQAMLKQLKQPVTSYTVRAAELYALTKDPIDKFRTGAMVRVQDKEIGEDVTFRVLNVRKGDVLGNPGEVEIDIANKPQDIAGTLADLRNRQYINDVYAQGATNYDSHNFADNCDPQHPAILKFWIPEETARINKVMLSFRVEAFRGYSRAIAGGGAVQKSTEAGGSSTPTTSTEPQRVPSTSTKEAVIQSASTSNNWDLFKIEVPDAVDPVFDHNHGIPTDTELRTADGGTVTFVASGAHSHVLSADHRHDVTIPAHDHTVTIPSHNHTVTIPPHTHEIEIPAHTHDIEFGIYEGPVPSQVVVRVDGVIVPGIGVGADEVDIIPYLSNDGNGKVKRGTFHEVTITPVNSLGRVVATVFTQIFAQSRGGGDY
ncbi:Prophage endopeptidase tail [compost metagenome]